MTTIVANLEEMAADQRCTSGGPMCHVTKMRRIGNSVFGFAGDTILAMHVLKWLEGKRDPLLLYKLIPESHRDSIEVLELSREGLSIWTGWGIHLRLLDATYALGSGAMPALQALRMNCSPAEAVLQAMQLDECSGTLSEPQVEKLNPERPLSRKRKHG